MEGAKQLIRASCKHAHTIKLISKSKEEYPPETELGPLVQLGTRHKPSYALLKPERTLGLFDLIWHSAFFSCQIHIQCTTRSPLESFLCGPSMAVAAKGILPASSIEI